MELIDLSSGASYFRSPGATTAAAIASLKEGRTSYGPTEGIPALRSAIAEHLSQCGKAFDLGNVLITPGTKQALYNLFTVLLQEDDEVVIPVPSWFGFYNLMKYCKGRLVGLPTSLETNYNISPEALHNVLSSKSRILLLTNPGNPTGRLYSKQELEAILEIAALYPNLYVIADEIYDLTTYGKPFTSIFSCKGATEERTITVNGFSKTFAMSGWRIGYIAGPKELISKCADFQGSTISGVSLFTQHAALAAFKNRDKVLEPMLEVLAENRKIMEQGLTNIPHVNFYVPDGAYYFFPDLGYYLGSTSPSGEKISSSIDLCHYLKNEYELQLSPGDYFGAPGHVRMSFAVEKHHLEQALHRLQAGLSALTHQA